MKLSLNWLKEYVGISAPVSELADRLTMLGLEVEDVHDLGERYRGFIVGAVLDVRKHPGADKLVLCRVNTGGRFWRLFAAPRTLDPDKTLWWPFPEQWFRMTSMILKGSRSRLPARRFGERSPTA